MSFHSGGDNRDDSLISTTESFISRRPPQSGTADFGKLEWRELELLLALSEAGSLRQGAAKLRCTVATIRRRLSRLEDKMGERLAIRGTDGIRLTARGQALLTVALQVRNTIDGRSPDGISTRPNLRIAVTEGLGSFWLMPRTLDFREAHPGIQVQLDCDMRKVDLTGDDFDIAVQLEPVHAPGWQCIRLGTMHLMPFATESYLEKAGYPTSVDDWRDHQIIWQQADQVAAHLLPFLIGERDPAQYIGIMTNSSVAHFRAIAAGGGIGMLPTYAYAITRAIRPIDINLCVKREIVGIFRSRDEDSSPVSNGIAWLRDAFSGSKYPWFADAFVHPTHFEQHISPEANAALFQGFRE
ncbi:LysR family transcriptional regulator [Sphingobium chungbukense]|uniref:LysR family transcriptional regulator n=1 Tax=Sphingobium chungbukense TaxID=56193 RepID=UPI00069A14E6|nr:LysR family transcriptional regulator [Sphingobium chungbukense]